MKRLLAVLLAAAIALPVAADTQVVCTITAQAQTACSAITVSEAARLDPCRCNANGGGGGAEPSVYDDAIALWKLDETSGTRADSIGSLDLTDNNTVGYANMGPSGTVASFIRANSEYLSHASIAVSEDHTLVMWYRLTGTFGALYEIENISYEYSGGNHVFGTGAGGISGLDYIEDGGWHMYAIRQDGSTAKGSNDAGTVFTRAVTPPAAAARAFRFNYVTGTDFSDQRMARIGFWNRALSDGELTAIYNSGLGKSYSDLTAAEKVGLVSYWNLDEASGNRADSHGSNTLTDNNTVTSATNTYPANLPGRVASFVAANSEYLSVTENTLLNGDIDWTVSLWVYRAAAGVDPVVSRENGATRSILLRGDGATSDASLFTRDYNDSVTKGGALTAGVWHNLIAWHDSVANEIGVSVDAGTPATASTGGANTTPNGTLAVGGRIANSYFTGQLSTVVIWPRVLTPDERAALYNSGAGAPLP